MILWEATAPKVFGEPARAIARNIIVIAAGFLPLLLVLGAASGRRGRWALVAAVLAAAAAFVLLRPFNYDTLATRVHAKASLENIADAAPAALMITLVGLAAVALLARANR